MAHPRMGRDTRRLRQKIKVCCLGAATNFLNKKENLIKAQNQYRVLIKINDEL